LTPLIRPFISVHRPFDTIWPAIALGAAYFPARAYEDSVMTTLVSLKGIVKGYIRGKQRVEVLHGMDLEIQAGEFLALMGPSGSGKTTLLNLIGGIDRADEGELLVAGERINVLSARALAQWRAHHVGFVFQFYNLMPLLTAEENVELPLLVTNLTKSQRSAHVKAVLELVGLADRASHKPAELSGGQQQRVAVARALVADPLLLLCDEPTGDLDREMAGQILDLLQMVNREQHKTIVMVTHDPKAAERATRQLHLDKGRLIQTQEWRREVLPLDLDWRGDIAVGVREEHVSIGCGAARIRGFSCAVQCGIEREPIAGCRCHA
jgi:putative ABC transport system ATP-binding protein